MQSPYLTLPFSFSDSAWRWATGVIKPIVEDFQRNAPLDAALKYPTQQQMNIWHSSMAWQELQEFFRPIGLEEPEMQFFIYKKRLPLKDNRGNPHIDTTGPDINSGDAIDIPIRFNILLDGDEDQEMFWWDRNRNDSVVVVDLFQQPDGRYARRLQASGKNRDEQYSAIGEPNWRCNNLVETNKKASFVRTDILHSINWTAHRPRFILSLRFKSPWSVIEDYRLRLSQSSVQQ